MDVIQSTVLFGIVAGYGVLFSWVIAGYFREIARMKGHREERYFWVPFVFTIAGYLLVIALPDRNSDTKADKATFDTDKTALTS